MEENIALYRTLREIEQMLHVILGKREDISREFVSLFQSRKIRKIFFSGQASGIYIGMMLKKFIEDHFDIEVQVTNPAAFLQNERFNVNHRYVPGELCMICPAHSGSTTGPVEMAKICRGLGIPVICTTYNTASSLAGLSDVVIYKYSGEEESYIETKGHFASMACLMMCFMEYGRQMGALSQNTYSRYIHQLEMIAGNVPAILEAAEAWYRINREFLLGADYARYIANGEYEGAALEGSLKIAETAHIAAIFYETEEFMHRATTQITRDSIIFILAPQGKGYLRNLDLRSWAVEYSDHVIFLTAKGDHVDGDGIFRIPGIDAPYFSVMEYILALEALAYYLCEDLHQSVIAADNDGASEKLNTHITG